MFYGHLKYRNIIKYKNQFIHLKNANDLAKLLKFPAYKINLLTLNPPYDIFEIRKEKGFRLIEAPKEPLMKILKILKNYLQSVYYFNKTDAAYGFILHTKNDKITRNIVTNANFHLHSKYMLNIDLKDFFHQIKYRHIDDIFRSKPFYFDDKLINFLARITLFNCRLPMGSPTSPVLSNLAMIPVDLELLHFAKSESLKYTRFVDDLTFSSDRFISAKIFEKIQSILSSYKLIINYEKIKTYSEDDIKVVTVLELRKKVSIPQEFFKDLDEDIIRFKNSIELNAKYNENYNNKLLNKTEQIINGKINFIALVYGENSKEFNYYYSNFVQAQNSYESIESINWLDIPYQFIYLWNLF